MPVDRSDPRIATAVRAAEDRTARFPRAVRPAAARDAGSLSVAWLGLTGERLDQDMRTHMVGMVVSNQLRRWLGRLTSGLLPCCRLLGRLRWSACYGLGRTSPSVRAGGPFLGSYFVARLVAGAEPE